jgi:septal ring factor EnvC (AmiA/AmiB activator)
MKNPKQLLGTSIIATLILSNAILGNEYSKDMKKYESIVNNQLKLIKQLKVSDSKNKQLINQKSNEINSKNKEINDLNTQLNQIKNENDSLKKKLQ